MSTQKAEKPKLRVSAKHIGPIMELEAELSNRSQHLIFARNGTEKSFIARALRLLDPASNEGEIEGDIPSILVSEEATNHQGTFGLFEGAQCIGSIELNAKARTVNRSTPSYIYHVFLRILSKHTCETVYMGWMATSHMRLSLGKKTPRLMRKTKS